jgi:formyltetrahydrofolate synthetase
VAITRARRGLSQTRQQPVSATGSGAGFIYVLSGEMRTMPGLSSHPAAEAIDIDENGDIVGLY